MWIQECNRESGPQDPPRHDEDSQQPEHHQLGHKKKELEVEDMNIEILTRNESVKYLVSFYQQETTEIKCRIRAAWATFHKYRQELTSKNYMLKHRLRLFDATVSPTVCYAAGTWAPKKYKKDCETRYWAQRRK